MEAFAEPVEVVMKTRPLSRDPSDDMILDLAINGRQSTGYEHHEAFWGQRSGLEFRCFPAGTVRENQGGDQDGN